MIRFLIAIIVCIALSVADPAGVNAGAPDQVLDCSSAQCSMVRQAFAPAAVPVVQFAPVRGVLAPVVTVVRRVASAPMAQQRPRVFRRAVGWRPFGRVRARVFGCR